MRLSARLPLPSRPEAVIDGRGERSEKVRSCDELAREALMSSRITENGDRSETPATTAATTTITTAICS